MSATQSRVPASVETMPISLWWALGIGTCATSLVALTVAGQIYLSMLTVALQPYFPVETFRFSAALILQTISLPIDLLVYGLLRKDQTLVNYSKQN